LAGTDLLNGERGRMRLGGVGVEVYHWAQMADTVVNPPHRHTYFEVCWVEDGSGLFVVDGRRHVVEPGALLFARPGVRHQIISERPPGIRLAWVAFLLSLPAERIDDDFDRLFDGFAAGPPLSLLI
jgi:mannose-6-phosphate isomerase-like protein (cupin superfamily)